MHAILALYLQDVKKPYRLMTRSKFDIPLDLRTVF